MTLFVANPNNNNNNNKLGKVILVITYSWNFQSVKYLDR